MAKVLIAEDHLSLRYLIAELVINAGHEVVSQASNGLEALKLYFETKPDLLIVDYEMPCMDGVTFLEEVRKIDHNVKAMMCTASIDLKQIRTRIHEYIPIVCKPFDNVKFIETMLGVLDN